MTAAGYTRGLLMRERIAERLAAWSALLLTWSNNVALRDYKRTRQEA